MITKVGDDRRDKPGKQVATGNVQSTQPAAGEPAGTEPQPAAAQPATTGQDVQAPYRTAAGRDMGEWLNEKADYNRPLTEPAIPKVDVPAVAGKPDRYTAPVENKTVGADKGSADFTNRGYTNLTDLVKALFQPYDYEKELAQAERARKGAMLADILSVAGNAIAGAFGANQLGKLPEAYKAASSNLDKIREAREKQLTDNRRVLLEAFIKDFEIKSKEEHDKKMQKLKDESDKAAYKRELERDRIRDAYQSRRDNSSHAWDSEEKEKEREFRRDQGAKDRASREKISMSDLRARVAQGGRSSKDVTIEYAAGAGDRDAVTSVTGKRVKKITLSPESAKNIVREALADKAFLDARPDIVLQQPDDDGKGQWKYRNDEDIIGAYMEYLEKRRGAAKAPAVKWQDYIYDFDTGDPYKGKPANRKHETYRSAGGVAVTNATWNELEKIAGAPGVGHEEKIAGMTEYLLEMGFDEDMIIRILSNTKITETGK